MDKEKIINKIFENGLVTAFTLMFTTILVIISNWIQFGPISNLFAPNGNLLNWNFITLIIIVTNLFAYLMMGWLWKNEYEKFQSIKNERDTLKNLLGDSQKLILTDVVT